MRIQQVVSQINIKVDSGEKESIAQLLLQSISGLSRTQLLARQDVPVSVEEQEKLSSMLARVNMHEPIQYILGYAPFYGRNFKVTPDVLIPRPETEELVSRVLRIAKAIDSPRIIDIGTGSGCIAVTIKLALPEAHVVATDNSLEAIFVASENAANADVEVGMALHDILKEPLPSHELDIVVSNPPYIPLSEKETLDENVVRFEPHAALFAPDNDPLVYYRSIAKNAAARLVEKGWIALETHERYGKAVVPILEEYGFIADLVADINGKDRFVFGRLDT